MATWLVEYWPWVNCDLDDPARRTRTPMFPHRSGRTTANAGSRRRTPICRPRFRKRKPLLLIAEVLSQVLGI